MGSPVSTPRLALNVSLCLFLLSLNVLCFSQVTDANLDGEYVRLAGADGQG